MSSQFRLAATAAALATSLLALGACNKPGVDAPPATDSANNSLATASPTVAGAEDAAAAAVGTVSAATTMTAQGFVTAAATSDMYEAQVAKLAEDKATSPAVKKFAAKMIRDHTGSTAKLTHILKDDTGLKATPPTDLDERRKGLENNLALSAPADFDKTYVDQQVAAHQEAVTLFSGYAGKGDNTALKNFAISTLPTIQAHLTMAKDMQAAMSK